MSITIILLWVRTRSTGQRYKVPVLRYRTPCGSNTNIWTNDKCKGWAWASPEVQLAFIDLYGEIRESRVYICPVLATSPECPGFPGVPLLLRPLLGGKVWFIMCSFTQSIHFLSYLVSSKPNISISSSWFRPEKMSMRAPVKYPYTKMVTVDIIQSNNQNQIFQYLLLISTPHNQISPE